MTARLLAVLACLVTLGCTTRSAPLPSPAATDTPIAMVPLEESSLSLQWERVPGLPDDDRWERAIYDVTAAGPDAAWAVGYTGWEDDVEGVLRHWDGSRWRKLPVRLPGSPARVDADGPHNVWAMAYGSDGAVALQWDGHAWRRHKPPFGGMNYSVGRDVAVDERRAVAISSSEALLWDGARFTKVLDLEEDKAELTAVDAGSGHTWIAGSWNERPMVWHELKGEIEQAAVPALPEGKINDIWQNNPSDVWAVGKVGPRSLILHWDGASWRQVGLPDWRGELSGVTAFGPDDVWITGLAEDLPSGYAEIMHWNGQTWTRELPPSPGEVTRAAIARIPGTSQIWLLVSIRNGDSESIVTFRRH